MNKYADLFSYEIDVFLIWISSYSCKNKITLFYITCRREAFQKNSKLQDIYQIMIDTPPPPEDIETSKIVTKVKKILPPTPPNKLRHYFPKVFVY